MAQDKIGEVINSLQYHPLAGNDEKAKKFEVLRNQAMDFAHLINEVTPASREQALAYTHLEETLMWAIKSLAIRD